MTAYPTHYAYHFVVLLLIGLKWSQRLLLLAYNRILLIMHQITLIVDALVVQIVVIVAIFRVLLRHNSLVPASVNLPVVIRRLEFLLSKGLLYFDQSG